MAISFIEPQPIKGTDGDGNLADISVLSDGKLDIEQTALYDAQMQMLKELKKQNLYLSLMNDTEIRDQDIEV